MWVCPVPVEWRLTESLFAVSGSWETSGGSPMSIAPESMKPTTLNRPLDSSGGLDPSVDAGAEGAAGPGAADDASITTSTWKRLCAESSLLNDGFWPDISVSDAPRDKRLAGKSTCSKTTGKLPHLIPNTDKLKYSHLLFRCTLETSNHWMRQDARQASLKVLITCVKDTKSFSLPLSLPQMVTQTIYCHLWLCLLLSLDSGDSPACQEHGEQWGGGKSRKDGWVSITHQTPARAPARFSQEEETNTTLRQRVEQQSSSS